MPPTSARTSSRLSAKAASMKTDDDDDDDQDATRMDAKKAPLKDDTNTKLQTTVKGAKKAAKSKVKGSKKTTAVKKESPKKRKKATADADEGKDSDTESSVASTKKESPKKRKQKANDAKDDGGFEEDKPTATKKAAKKKASPKKMKRATAKVDDADDDDNSQASKKSTKKKKKAKEPVQSITERDELPKLWTEEKAKENGSYTLKIGSWNVAGLRALMRKEPDALANLCKEHSLDVLCLQETKLQEMHLDDPKLKIRGHLLEEEGYDAYYSCSVAKKGYSGTSVFVKRRGVVKAKQKTLDSFFTAKKTKGEAETSEEAPLPVDPKLLVPEKVSYGLGNEKHDAEGRVICLEFPGFTMANLYVPNSGQKLERLGYRTAEWDKDLVAFAKEKQETRGVPVMWLGDLNVAHRNLEAYNFGAKHLDKQAGLTPQERASFQEQLDSGFVDAFRHLHPTAKGHYSYWSQRAGNREPNKGLRLDYFVCDSSFFEEDSKIIARDSYMIPDQLGSDHGPVVLELEMKP